MVRGEKNRVVQIKKGGRVLISQTTNRNNDGFWDELLIEINLAAYAKDTLKIKWVDAKNAVVFPVFTGMRLSLRSDTPTPSPEIKKEVRLRGFTQNITRPYYQMEGPGIENDKVVFRTFVDRRNGKDIYGKIADTPILERVGLGASWHELQPWGMDIFHTGTSLGAGDLAVADKGKIYRLGDADTSTFEVLYKGSLAAAFRLGFTGWEAGRSKRDGSGSLFGLSKLNSRTIAIEVGMQNGGIASGVAVQMGKIATVGLAPAVNGPVMNTTFSLIATWWGSKPVAEPVSKDAVFKPILKHG